MTTRTNAQTSRRLLLFVPLIVAAHGKAPARADALTAKFEQYMDACVAVDQFSGTVHVTRDGSPIFSKGYGLANIEHQVPNTPETKFRLGSITKQFTAMAIMILKEDGKLGLEDPIGKYLDDPPGGWDAVTIHHLLSHTSGVPSYTSDPDYPRRMTQRETVKSMIARFKDKPLEFTPGEKFAYSNSGYFLLGAIIERVSGTTYEAFLKRAVFDALGMSDSGYDHSATVLPRRAAGYIRKGDVVENAEYLDMTQPFAAGSLYSTVLDLTKWDRALTEGRLISPESMARMFAPVKNEYAYGWSVASRSGRKEVSHGGGINGFVTNIARFPDDHVCVVVLCNMPPANPGRMSHDLSAIAFGEPYKLPRVRTVAKIDPQLYDAYAGRYMFTPERIMTITREGDHLMVQLAGQRKLEVFPESETEFFLKINDMGLSFVKDEKGAVTHVVVHQGGRDTRLKRLEPETTESPR